MGEDFFVAAWKRQIDLGFGWMEAALEATGKLYEARLSALVEAHACIVATRRAMQEARTAADLARIQADCLGQNLAAAQAYWRAVGTIATDTQRRVGKSMVTG